MLVMRRASALHSVALRLKGFETGETCRWPAVVLGLRNLLWNMYGFSIAVPLTAEEGLA